MATIVNLKRAIQEIKLDDSPDSPVYILDLTDSKIASNVKRFKGMLEELGGIKNDLDNLKKRDEIPLGIRKRIAACYEDIITETLGSKAYKEILEYAGGKNVKAEEVTTALSPLIIYLTGEINEAVRGNNEGAFRKYLGEEYGAASM